ncbi:MAG TPA: MFS transporter [Vitreimonas sp.]|nr:MFS transporter [Vitreimonas sp.]
MGRLSDYARRFTGFDRDARRYLLVTIVAGAAISLYWIDFNLYLAALGVPRATIGLIATGSSLAGAIVAFPASSLSNRIGRRGVIVGGLAVMAVAMVGLLFTSSVVGIALLAATFGAGQQAVFVTQSPFLTEHSRPEHRSELFSLHFAIINMTNVAAAVLGGVGAGWIASIAGFAPESADVYRIVLAVMAVLLAASVALAITLGDDRPSRTRPGMVRSAGEPAAFPLERPDERRRRIGFAIADRGRYVRLVLPGFLIAVGAGQVIPFLNLFVQRKFGLELASLNAVFALTSIGTMVAILLQPALARRLGRVGSVVAVQGASIPFLVALGFSPVLWTVVLAMAVRNSLMNAGNPILNAFAMDQVRPGERATLAATMSALWSVGWVIGGPYYSVLQATLGFEAGYSVNFLTIIVLYSVATALYWFWFRDAEPQPSRAAVASGTD